MRLLKPALQPHHRAGQTMIETLVAIFILIMGISAAVGLAIYAYSSSSNISKQIIAVGLAREGLEAVRNMRDTNWLKLTSIDTNCYDYASSTAYSAKCYGKWLQPPGSPGNGNDMGYDLSVAGNYIFTLNPTLTNKYWQLQTGGVSGWGMDFDQGINGSGFAGFYVNTGNSSGSSGFYRKITITQDTSGVFNPASYGGANNPGPMLKVDAYVWWVDKKCPAAADYASAKAACRLNLETFLTNWKNY